MTSTYTNELYEKIKKAREANEKKGGFKNVLKTKPENTYIVRLIPNADDPSKTLFQYYTHGWNSATDGQYVSTVCPTTYGEKCPICAERFRLWNKGDEASKELSKLLARKERFLANVYVVDDPVNTENNGTVKMLNYGRQIAKIIDEAMNGDDAEDVGGRMFDFSKEGCNLRVKVEKNAGGYPNYDRSKFLSPSDLPISLEDILEEIHDFDPLLIRKTEDEMKEMLESALYGADLGSEETPVKVTTSKTQPAKAVEEEEEDDIPMNYESSSDTDADIMAGLDELSKM